MEYKHFVQLIEQINNLSELDKLNNDEEFLRDNIELRLAEALISDIGITNCKTLAKIFLALPDFPNVNNNPIDVRVWSNPF